jgi:hypothetical protein
MHQSPSVRDQAIALLNDRKSDLARGGILETAAADFARPRHR